MDESCAHVTELKAFEKELEAVVCAENVVTLESGTSATHLALILCGVKPGAKYINSRYISGEM